MPSALVTRLARRLVVHMTIGEWMARRILAIGAHIGDMDLAAGPMLAAHALAGDSVRLLALTPGERGHPRMTPADYKAQKVAEGERFAETIGAEFEVFDDLSDGYLDDDEVTAMRVADRIAEHRPDVVVAHWPRSIHTDHVNASRLAERGRFLAGLPDDDGTITHRTAQLVYTENWEDADGFAPTTYVRVPDEAFELWRQAIGGQAFARGETYGFRYIDYYSAQLVMRGCLAGVPRACAFADAEPAAPLVDAL